LFGYFAGIMYWFPKFTGYTLSEIIGKYTFWFWFIGFILAFVPLYILGIMGATRRLDHYSASMGWQSLFIVAGVGSAIIAGGVGLIILQQVVSFFKRKQNIDKTGDPWNGRTLEWSIPSPAPFYNFAITPEVKTRDAFWEMKKNHVKGGEKEALNYRDIIMPNNSAASVFIGCLSVGFGFGMIWHIWWLSIISLVGIIVAIIIRTTSDNTEHVITAAEIEELDKKYKNWESFA
jgi:cytochrome o ubiquinol oxidase subunit 1